MSEVLDKVPLDCETKAVLAGQSSMLRPPYQLMLAHESGGVASRSAARSEEVASLYRQAPPWARDLSSGASIVYFRLPGGHFSVSRVGFQTCRNVLLCKTAHALPLALSGTNEYHEIVLIGHVPALAFRAQWFQTARRTC
jgi:hypothetical protein